MNQQTGVKPGLVSGQIVPGQASDAAGIGLEEFTGPVEYEGHERGAMRHAWTKRPDRLGRYHALTLHREDDGSWIVIADQPFERADDAEEWSFRLFEETAN